MEIIKTDEMEKLEAALSFARISVQIRPVGADYLMLVEGGKPHIGCTVLAIPRPSLTGDGSVSVTSSVLNVTGHKDEEICRYLAERLCAARQRTVVCTGGFHVDQITREQLAEVLGAVKEMGEQLGKSDQGGSGKR